MNNKKDIEEDIKFIKAMIEEYKTFKDLDNPEFENTDKIYKALENILADRERLEKEKEELKEKLNKKDKIIESMRFIKNTSRYEDTILIDEDKVNYTKNRFLIELNNGKFVEVNTLKSKANKYDSLIKEIEDKIKEIGEYSDTARELIEEKIVIADSDSLNFGRQQAHNKDREVLRELLYKQKEKV